MKDELFDLDGEKYENCRKKAYTARTKHDNRPWWTTDYTILFSKDQKYYLSPQYVDENDRFRKTISPEYGYVKLSSIYD